MFVGCNAASQPRATGSWRRKNIKSYDERQIRKHNVMSTSRLILLMLLSLKHVCAASLVLLRLLQTLRPHVLGPAFVRCASIHRHHLIICNPSAHETGRIFTCFQFLLVCESSDRHMWISDQLGNTQQRK